MFERGNIFFDQMKVNNTATFGILVGFFAVLVIFAVQDIREKSIKLENTLLLMALAVFIRVMLCKCPVYEKILGIAPGVLFLACAYFTKEKIGYGDGLITLGIGIFTGMWPCILVCLLACFLAAFVGVILLVSKKITKGSSLPFIPFLTASYVLVMIGGYL